MASDPAFAEDKMRNCFTLLQKLRKHKFGWVFNEPVDPVALNIPDYFDVIKNPMDFSTIQNKMEAGMYSNIEEFAEDARLTFENALLYNQPKSEIGTMTKTLLELFEKEYSKIALGDSKTRLTSPKAETPKRQRDDSSQPNNKRKRLDNLPMTYDEKLKLSENISKLNPSRLAKFVDIVQQCHVVTITGEESEIEFDLDELDNTTLRTLQNFVESGEK
eukprot:TRINITY_DN6634_c0_g1_i2.p1 TRINITY_DN6634_c0_g1~~TRINITY_DN6634_c0_g1_i2.p1  ORF type:complete len:218 (-),score=45.43 TRINITY_DN6634_c0_g1_i2:19-672(-)